MTLPSKLRSLIITYYTNYDYNELMQIIKNADGYTASRTNAQMH